MRDPEKPPSVGFDYRSYGVWQEMQQRDKRLEAEANDPWRAFLAFVSNFIIFAVFGLAVVSVLAVIVYVAIDLLRR